MAIKPQPLQYYSFAFSNFLAAFGGGIILGKGVNAINISSLKGGSILAFFIGTVFGLILLQIMPKKLAQSLSNWFSIFGGIASLILFSILEIYGSNEKLVNIAALSFFIIMCARFGFWFYSRVLRASKVAGHQRKIAWVELGYYLGMISGLIIWQIMKINILLSTALIIDVILQICAGFLDLSVSTIVNDKKYEIENNIDASVKKNLPTQTNFLIWRLGLSVTSLTVCIQVIIFKLAHQVSEFFTPYILSFFYLGVAIAALFYKKFQIRFDWENHQFPKMYYTILQNEKSLRFNSLILLAAISVGVAICGVNYFSWGNDNSLFQRLDGDELFLLVLITLAAFLYETLALAMLDKIAVEETLLNRKGAIIRTYGLMGIASAIILWLLGLSSHLALTTFFVLLSCFIASNLLIKKKNSVIKTALVPLKR